MSGMIFRSSGKDKMGKETDQYYKQLLLEDPDSFKAQLNAAERAVIQLARKDPAVFCQYVLKDERSGKPVKLSKIHREFHKIALEHNRSVIWAHPEVGKPLCVSEFLPTAKGMLQIKDVHVGDTVYGSDGKPTKVTWESDIYKDKDNYRLEFDDGSMVVADADHVWKVQSRQDRHNHRPYRTVTTAEMAVRVTLSDGRCNWSIPITAAVEYPEQQLAIDPYTLGAWLGDGNSRGPRLTMHEDDIEVFNCIEAKHPGGHVYEDQIKPHIKRPRIGPVCEIMSSLKFYDVIKNKHIPEVYLRGSVSQRKELLAGLLDTDGSVSRAMVEFCNTNKRLAYDVLSLVRSLGHKARMRVDRARCNGKDCGERYRVFFTPNCQVFKLNRKAVALEAQQKRHKNQTTSIKYVTAIVPVGKKDTKCIAVDNNDHTFLVGDHYTVTHNCEVSGTKVLLADGTWADIESLHKEVEIVAFDPRTLKFKVCKAGPVEDNGVKATIKFVTETGEVVNVTYEHPLATQRGWVKAKDIVAGDSLLNVIKVPVDYTPGYGDYSLEDAHLLGWMLHSPAPKFVSVDGNPLHWTQKFYSPRKMFVVTSQKDRKLFHPEVTLIGKLVNSKMESYRNKRVYKKGTNLSWIISDRSVQQLYIRHMLTKNTIRNGVKVSDFQDHVYRAPMDWQVQLLRAFFAGASATPAKKTGKETIHKGQFYPSGLTKSVNSYNYSLLRGIKLIMTRLGFPCKLKAHTKDCQLDISGNTYRRLEVDEDVMRHIMENCKGGWVAYNSPAIRMSRVISVVYPESTPGSKAAKKCHKQTWALPVHDDCHCYISNGVVSHNTNQISIGHTLWRLGCDPNMCILVVSNTKDQAGKIITAMKNYIVNSKELHKVFPHLKPGRKWAEHSFSVVRPFERAQPSVIACGIKASIMGFRANYLIMDDVDDMETTLTETSRADTLRWIQSTPFSRLSEDAGVFAIGNVWHEDDLLHTLAKKDGWFSKKFPVLDQYGNSTWPEKFPETRIEQIKIDQGPLEFARLYMCEPKADGQQRFKKEWLDVCCQNGEGRLPLEAIDTLPRGYRCYTGVDIGHRVKLGSDPTAITTILASDKGDYEIIDVEAGLWDVMTIADKIRDKQQRYDSVVYVESNGAQEFLVQILRTTGERIPVKPFVTGKNKHDPKYGIESIAAEMATGRWTIPSALGTIESTCKEMRLLIDGLLSYNPNPRVHTADRVMSLWIAREAARQEQTRPKAQVGRINITAR